MARIAGVDLPREKRIEISLQYIYGIGKTTAKKICAKAEVARDHPHQGPRPTTRSAASAKPSSRRSRWRATSAARPRSTSSASWISAATAGLRHRKGLPVRGQRTHTNARTRKGPKRGLVRKPAAAPAPKA